MNPQVSNDELDPKNPDALIVSQKILTGIPFSQTFRVKRDVLVEMDQDVMYDELRIRLEERVIAEKLADDVYTESIQFWSPSSTWQMFKRTHKNSWWLGWLVRRRPVVETAKSEYVSIAVGRYALYPDAEDIRFPALGRPVPYESIRRL